MTQPRESASNALPPEYEARPARYEVRSVCPTCGQEFLHGPLTTWTCWHGGEDWENVVNGGHLPPPVEAVRDDERDR